MASSKFDIIVYGATGFTGQLVAEYLAAHYKGDGNLKWAMAGRSREKLASVRDAIGAPADTALIEADASDPASLKAMVAQAKSVVSSVGPYQLYGSELVAACVASGTDYLDLCGEPLWMRQMIETHEATAKSTGARIVFSCGFDSLPFELGVFCAQKEARKAFGAPANRVKGRVRAITLTVSGGTAASMRGLFAAAANDHSLVALLRSPFALTPGFEGPKQPPGNRPVFDQELDSWTAPFVMANINTRNVHRSNLLMGFSYGKDFVYDEMMLTGPGEQGEASARRITAANTSEKMNASGPRPGRGAVERGAGKRLLRSAVRRDCPRRSPGSRLRPRRPRSRLRIDLQDDLGMRDLPAAGRAGGASRHLDARCGHGRQADQAARRPCRHHVQRRELALRGHVVPRSAACVSVSDGAAL